MTHHTKRYTALGSAKVEKHVQSILDEVAHKVQGVIPAHQLKALVLIGGYGRGEGGVTLDRQGEERCNNNLDFILITTGLARPSDLERRCRDALRPLVETYELGFDVSAVHATRLRRAAPRMIWYDMRHGHRTIVGDADFVPSLERFDASSIPSWDARDLLVNRGTLLLINDMLLEDIDFCPSWRPIVVRHAIKAIIGYGDALLYFLGEYHWSYREKRTRMMAREDVSLAFRALYDEAVSFRFQPNYSRFDAVDLVAWAKSLKSSLRPIHLACEAARLDIADLSWDRYLGAALERALVDEPFSTRAWASKAGRGVRSLARRGLPGAFDLVTWSERYRGALLTGVKQSLGSLVCGARGLLPLLFPFLVYEFDLMDEHESAQRFLGASSSDQADLREAYLDTWSQHGDCNYATLLERLGIQRDSDPKEKAA